jgi:bifunctional non-homologous end joining protein LigD
MALEKYKTKRKFNDTPEPKGKKKVSAGPLRFVVQKHAASHLHYDFRLELDGVLKSWAVPKGPSLNPSEKRLAMMVEDHPYDYRTFEGTIPKGNYGAGEVIVWDEGFYSAPEISERRAAEQALKKGLDKGDLKFVLYGHKLRGEFVLAKIKGKEDNAWLLIKKKDRYASSRDVREDDRSVRSSRRLPDPIKDKPAIKKVALGAGVKAAMPHNVKPMLATLVEEPFDRKGWIFEMKHDGFRAVSEISPGRKPVIYSRNNLPLNTRFPEIAEALGEISETAVLDGEIVSVDEKGISRFQLLQNFHREPQGKLRYYVFDVLYLNGRDLRDLPLRERKRILRDVLPDSEVVRYSDHIEEQGRDFYREARKIGLEGVIAKNEESPYRTGKRSSDWLKIKIVNEQEAVIAGFTAPRGSRKNIGALVLGVYEGDDLIYIGHTGGGLEKKLEMLHDKLLKLKTDTTPFRRVPKTNMPVTWVLPKLVCQVKFQEWTSGGHMRQPIFLGLREDKKPEEVRREKPALKEEKLQQADHPNGVPKKGGVLIDGHVVELSNLDKVYWPKEKYTKRDLISYYREIAPVILPYLIDRPESLHRHPNGIEGESFFQKDVDHMPPPWVGVAEIYSESNGKNIRYLVCQDEATLAYMANLGCIELNPWLSRADALERPDFALFDLDPEKIGFAAVVQAAQEVHRVLDSLEVPSFVKTSGATGLHIVVPLGAKYEYDQSKQFAEIVMRLVNRTLKKTTSVERSPEKRQRKVYLDFLQNRKGQTMAAPYCVRPRPGAPVSMPLEWKEVKKGLDPSKFTIRNALLRVDKKEDLWEPLQEAEGVDMARILEKLERLQ